MSLSIVISNRLLLRVHWYKVVRICQQPYLTDGVGMAFLTQLCGYRVGLREQRSGGRPEGKKYTGEIDAVSEYSKDRKREGKLG